MVCDSVLQKAFRKTCCICNNMIGYGDYETVKTRSHTYGKKKYPSETLYMHTECYNKEYNMNLPLYSSVRRVSEMPDICK